MKHERISIDPAVMMGKPCIRGTRLPVEQVLRELGDGLSITDILEAHPHLTTDDVEAALHYAANLMHKSGYSNAYSHPNSSFGIKQ